MAGNLNDLFPGRAALKGPKLISFDLNKFFVSQVENNFDDIVAIRDEWPFDVLVCEGAFYAEHLVADVLGIPVYAVGLTMVMPDSQAPPPFFGLRPARTHVGKLQHAIVRKLLAGSVKAGTIRYNQIINSRIGYNRLGIDLRVEHPKPLAIRKAVGRVINDPTYAENVAALRSELLSYDPMARIEAVVTPATNDAAV